MSRDQGASGRHAGIRHQASSTATSGWRPCAARWPRRAGARRQGSCPAAPHQPHRPRHRPRAVSAGRAPAARCLMLASMPDEAEGVCCCHSECHVSLPSALCPSALRAHHSTALPPPTHLEEAGGRAKLGGHHHVVARLVPEVVAVVGCGTRGAGAAGAGVSLGRCWRLLAAAGRCWPLLAAAGRCWRLLAAAGRCWRLLAAAGGCWPLLAAAGGCWRLLAAAGRCWPAAPALRSRARLTRWRPAGPGAPGQPRGLLLAPQRQLMSRPRRPCAPAPQLGPLTRRPCPPAPSAP
jgi:hypothetical protein